MDKEHIVEENSIDLMELFYVIRRNIVAILIAGVIGCIIGYVYTATQVVPQYQAWATMIVNNSQDGNTSGTMTTSEMDSSKSLIDTYAIIIKSDRVLNKVIENLDLVGVDYTVLAKKITVTSVNGTQIMQVSISDANPEFAYALVQELVTVAPDIIVDVVEAGSVKMVTEPQMPTTPLSINLMRNTVIVGFIFAMAVVGVTILKALLDTRIKSESDMERLFDVPVLGTIPTIESCEKSKKGGYYGHN